MKKTVSDKIDKIKPGYNLDLESVSGAVLHSDGESKGDISSFSNKINHLNITIGKKDIIRNSLVIEFAGVAVRGSLIRNDGERIEIFERQELRFDRKDTERFHKIIAFLRKFTAGVKAGNLQTILLISGPEIQLKIITTPKLPDSELRQAVYWQIKNDILNFEENSIWDFKVVGEVIENEKENLKIMAVVVPDSLSRRYVSLLEQVGITPQMVSVKPLALANSIQKYAQQVELPEHVLVVDIDYDSTLLCFVNNGVPEFFRSINFGDDRFTEAMSIPVHFKQKHIKMTPEKISVFKSRYGILKDFITGTNRTFFPHNQIFRHIMPVLHSLLSELRRSLLFYSSSVSGRQAEQIILTGPGSELKNLHLYLSSKMDIPVECPAQQLSDATKGSGEYRCMAIAGAALSHDKYFNFLPPDIKKDVKIRKWIKPALSFSLTVVLVLLLATFFVNGKRNHFNELVRQMKLQYQQLRPSESKYRTLQKNIKALKNKLARYSTILKPDDQMQRILKLISSTIPDDIILNKIEFQKKGLDNTYPELFLEQGGLTLEGRIYRNMLTADITLLNFMKDLRGSGIFKDVRIGSKSKQLKFGVFVFKIECDLK